MTVEQMMHPNKIPLERVEFFRRWLYEWRTPSEMITFVKDAMTEVGSERLFRQPDLNVLQEAWAAAHFASARHASKVRLVAEAWPDFEHVVDKKNRTV